MKLDTDSPEFWNRVEREMRNTDPNAFVLFNLLLKAGIYLALFTAAYLVLYNVLEPPRGFFVTPFEIAVHPFFWGIFGVILIVTGAILRYRAMGPAMERVRAKSY
ncbi:hypothetical protein V5T82_06520 [Magnetovibrio sp. PR-2]|uniref:hypothetical protein n=1 Tax=Magnetovibrio sp. PR-2 TaxID=3120356 RepID=UPI002FCE40E7